MAIARVKCCEDCVAPKRHLRCHSKCEEYKKEKAAREAELKMIREKKAEESKLAEFELNGIKKSMLRAHTRTH